MDSVQALLEGVGVLLVVVVVAAVLLEWEVVRAWVVMLLKWGSHMVQPCNDKRQMMERVWVHQIQSQ